MMSPRVLCQGQLPRPLWLIVRRMPRLCTGGFRRLQFFTLLLTRSYRGLIPALNWWDVIDEHFCLGGALMFDDIERLQQQGVSAVINLCAEREDDQERLGQACMEYLRIPVIDRCAPTFEQITQGVSWIECQLIAGRVIYIHCAAGVGRSAMLLASWYVYAHGATVAQALALLKTRHPQVSLTRRQIHRLHEYANLLQQPHSHASLGHVSVECG
jgi:atypical dual specificity phosphatase